ncbi:endothelin-converting enzyme [Flavobacteriaceae bacterium UJ101]|nr:endothelin-converting enzyme [Flavobacteriaceae bacterium UJ101]
MKLTYKSVVILGAILSFYSCNQPKQEGKSEAEVKDKVAQVPALDMAMMDQSVKPQEDFYNYSNGGWEKIAKIPDDKSRWGSFNELIEMNDSVTLAVLEKAMSQDLKEGSTPKKIADLFASVLNTENRNKQGIEPIKAHLAEIDAIQTKEDLQKYLAKAQKESYGSPLGYYVYADMNNSSMNTIYLNAGDLGLDQDYYQKDDAKDKVEKYQKYVASMLQNLGEPEKEATEEAGKIVAFEKALAQNMIPIEKSRDNELTNNPYKVADLKKLTPSIDWKAFFANSGIENVEGLIVTDLEYFKGLEKLLNDTPLETIKSYLKWIDFNSAAGLLNMELEQQKFDFYSKELRGVKEMRPIKKRALSAVSGVLGEAVGEVYVADVFPPEAKASAKEMVDYLFKSYKKHIGELTWMSDETKKKAFEKLDKITVKIGYPDKWKDYSSMEITSSEKGGSYYQNMKNASKWYNEDNRSKYGKPVDKGEWGMPPQMVNAYYNPLKNEIVFPAAILQPPFFNFNADAAINFGGIGGVIGHEISHGFDDSGSQFDAEGNQKNWWTKEDREKFNALGDQLVAQYDAYQPLKDKGNDIHVNGRSTLGENIADLGGTSVAYDALLMYLKDKGMDEKELIDNLTPAQRFFVSWATIWRTKFRDDALVDQIKTDYHAPGMYRATGPLENHDGFHKAFDTKEGDKMFKKEDDRIKIW